MTPFFDSPTDIVAHQCLAQLSYKVVTVAGNALSCYVESLFNGQETGWTLWEKACEDESDSYLQATGFSIIGEMLWHYALPPHLGAAAHPYAGAITKSLTKVCSKYAARSATGRHWLWKAYLEGQARDLAGRVTRAVAKDFVAESNAAAPSVIAAAISSLVRWGFR